MKKFLMIALLFAVSTLAVAQTAFSGPRFSASFNGAVTSRTYNNATNSNVEYSANDGTIVTSVTVRTVNHPIAVNFESANFYHDQACGEGAKQVGDVNNAYYQGHPFAFSICAYTAKNDVPYYTMERVIIVDATTVIFIDMDVPQSIADVTDSQVTSASGKKNAFVGWVNFENTLTIK
jgi:hypothetical protein